MVGGLSETTAVLKAVFEPRGHAVNRVRQSQVSNTPTPRVVIWHATESENTLPVGRFPGVPQILIGRADLPAADGETPQFSQPFEYCELLQTIESLLAKKKDVA